MSKQHRVENAYVLCPYYKYESQSVIYCEGNEDDSSIHMAFSSSTQRKQYEKQFCQQCWKDCLIADAHNRRWEYKA